MEINFSGNENIMSEFCASIIIYHQNRMVFERLTLDLDEGNARFRQSQIYVNTAITRNTFFMF